MAKFTKVMMTATAAGPRLGVLKDGKCYALPADEASQLVRFGFATPAPPNAPLSDPHAPKQMPAVEDD